MARLYRGMGGNLESCAAVKRRYNFRGYLPGQKFQPRSEMHGPRVSLDATDINARVDRWSHPI